MYVLHLVMFFPLQSFLEAAVECCKIHNVQPTEFFLNKMIQTYEMMIVRHGYVALVCFFNYVDNFLNNCFTE